MAHEESDKLRVVTGWARARGLRFVYHSGGVSRMARDPETGVLVLLSGCFELSVQTDVQATACGETFAETSLLYRRAFVRVYDYEEHDFRWEDPEDLFRHVLDMRGKLDGHTAGKDSAGRRMVRFKDGKVLTLNRRDCFGKSE